MRETNGRAVWKLESIVKYSINVTTLNVNRYDSISAQNRIVVTFMAKICVITVLKIYANNVIGKNIAWLIYARNNNNINAFINNTTSLPDRRLYIWQPFRKKGAVPINQLMNLNVKQLTMIRTIVKYINFP